MFVCKICGHISFGNEPPEKCPVCHAPSSAFNKNDEALKAPADPDNLTDAEKKHMPLVTIDRSGEFLQIVVSVGEIEHPMESEHWIMYIDLYINDVYQSRVSFAPGGILYPAAELISKETVDIGIKVVSTCNKHGAWLTGFNLAGKAGYVCTSCGMSSDTTQHLCSPMPGMEPYTCSHCGKKTDDIRHVCVPKLSEISYVCASCGRLADDVDTLCKPVPVED